MISSARLVADTVLGRSSWLTNAVVKDFVTALFDRTDSYNAWDAEGTENHTNMARSGGYIFSELATEMFPNDFPTATTRLSQMKGWIMDYSKRLYAGGAGEFNSTIYTAFNLMGWLMLYDWAQDEDVRLAARAVLDYYAVEMAVYYSQGTLGGTDMRGNRNTTSFEGTAGFFGWLWYDDLPTSSISFNNDAIYTVYAALSSYRPPLPAIEIANRTKTIPAFYKNSSPKYLLDSPGYIKKNHYVDEDFSLGSAYFPYCGWSSADWQIVSWKLISKSDPSNSSTSQFVTGFINLGTKGCHSTNWFNMIMS